jgi:hypothetical protein
VQMYSEACNCLPEAVSLTCRIKKWETGSWNWKKLKHPFQIRVIRDKSVLVESCFEQNMFIHNVKTLFLFLLFSPFS